MKRILIPLSLLLLVFTTQTIRAQETYLHLGAGYGFKSATGILAGFYNNDLSLQSYTESQVLMSLGAGTDLDLGFIVYGDNGMGFSIRYSYLFGSTAYAEELSNVSVVDKTITNHLQGRYSRVVPALTLRGEVERVTPYMQVGAVIAWGKATWDQYEDLGLVKNQTSWEYTGGIAAGAMGAFGIMIETGQIARVFIETTYYSMAWAPEKKIMTVAIVDDDDILDSYPLSVREIHYESERTIDYNNPPSENDPDIQLKFSMPMSSIGIRAGVRLML